MFRAVKSPYLVPTRSRFSASKAPTKPTRKVTTKESKERLEEMKEELYDLQRKFYANDTFSLLLVFQAMDAAGKDSTIRHVFSGINPAGFQVFSFKKPSNEEVDHDFLWRTTKALPERGRIGIFNRSYYEEVLVVKVHPEFLNRQRLPFRSDKGTFWKSRYESILNHEEHLAKNGTIILKFWLNVSKEEQRQRFISRIEEPHKNWKFSEGDLEERKLWRKYMTAYGEMIRATSTRWAPWYSIPADNKPYMRATVAETVVKTLKSLKLSYPKITKERRQELLAFKDQLENE
ncbi:MAG: polyphosphate kinase 2 family protein [Candidatus Eisenbacteria bacterium]|uniref:Polyphosphate kinase 2 family protein n=1 Tax=Eiseniibacteriota bacterium TaxID=2212470 RepID=A0A7Y2H1X4_UNCEI|nr:polyphosphate kinase 2 family protein [Candidatus Eisenbacteria bacterium]